MANQHHNETLRQLVKKKGVGASMGKHLDDEELTSLKDIFHSEQANQTTKATLLTAILTLDTTKDEQAWIDAVKKSPSKFLPTKLMDFLPKAEIKYHKNKNEIDFLTTIKKVISGKDLKKNEFKTYFDYCFDTSIPDYLKAAFLEAERLKRETFDENMACLELL
jgi:Anthranilate phosphoribosyltransferase